MRLPPQMTLPSTRGLIAIAASALALLAAVPAAAQLGDSKQPIDIVADEAEAHNADCTSTWRGSAEALQGNLRLRADVITAHMTMTKGGPKQAGATDGGGCGDLATIDAKGSVYFVTPTRRVRGDAAVYDASNTTVTITGDVIAVEGQNVLRGTKMVYNTQTGAGHVEGAGKGRNAKNRPRGVFYPKDSDAASDQPKDKARP